MRKGLLLTVLGLGGGLIVAFFSSRLLEGFLYELSPSDPVTFLSVTLILLLVALVASLVPALRATRLDPTRCLR